MSKKNYLLPLMISIIVSVSFIALYKHSPKRTSPIAGAWQADMTSVYNQIYNKHRISVVNAHSTTIFYDNGTYFSKDTATFIASSGPIKGARAPYRAWNKGVYVFTGDHGNAAEVDGDRGVNGNHIDVTLPDTITLKLLDGSSLKVVEDYGPRGHFEYVYRRNIQSPEKRQDSSP